MASMGAVMAQYYPQNWLGHLLGSTWHKAPSFSTQLTLPHLSMQLTTLMWRKNRGSPCSAKEWSVHGNRGAKYPYLVDAHL